GASLTPSPTIATVRPVACSPAATTAWTRGAVPWRRATYKNTSTTSPARHPMAFSCQVAVARSFCDGPTRFLATVMGPGCCHDVGATQPGRVTHDDPWVWCNRRDRVGCGLSEPSVFGDAAGG